MKYLDELYKSIKFVNETPGASFDMDKVDSLFDKVENRLKMLETLLRKKVNIYDEIYSCVDYEDYRENFGYVQETFNLSESEFNQIKTALK